MYGLTDYWVEGDNLHYVTNYGGKNSVPLELIDLGTTIRLNSERGIEFSLHTKVCYAKIPSLPQILPSR